MTRIFFPFFLLRPARRQPCSPRRDQRWCSGAGPSDCNRIALRPSSQLFLADRQLPLGVDLHCQLNKNKLVARGFRSIGSGAREMRREGRIPSSSSSSPAAEWRMFFRGGAGLMFFTVERRAPG